MLLASTTGGATTVARILGQPGEASPIFATPRTSGSGPDAFKPAVEIPASALDEANGARRFSLSSVLMSAYQEAVDQAPASCNLSVPLLAAIGQVESGSLVGRTLDADHRVTRPVLGPVLDGNGFAAVADTDDGSLDGDTTWDRAMGPMQFIPSTWRAYGVDGDGDGATDPQDVDDAAASAAAYLCADGRDLSTEDGVRDAVLSYNNSQAYYFLVLRWKTAFENASSLVVEEPDFASAPVSAVAGAMLSQTLAPTPDMSAPSAAPRPAAARTRGSGVSGPATPSASPSASAGSSPSGSPSISPVSPSPSPGAGTPSPVVPPPSTGTPTPTGPTPSPTNPSPTNPSPTNPSPTNPSPTNPSPSPTNPSPSPTDPTSKPADPKPSPTDSAPDCAPVDPTAEDGVDPSTEGEGSALGDSAGADQPVGDEIPGDQAGDGEDADTEPDDGCPDVPAAGSDGTP